jgi:diaminopimelate epimerase
MLEPVRRGKYGCGTGAVGSAVALLTHQLLGRAALRYSGFGHLTTKTSCLSYIMTGLICIHGCILYDCFV